MFQSQITTTRLLFGMRTTINPLMSQHFASFHALAQRQETSQKLLPFTINNLWDNAGARRQKKIIGRGPGSGLGKTAGKGHKG